MNHHLPRRSVTKLLLLLSICSVGNIAHAAQAAATVTHLSGLLFVSKAGSAARIAAAKSALAEGDTLVTGANTYARIKFVDDSEITLKPNTTFKIDTFAFDPAKPDADKATFSLVKGGLRSVTGTIGKRGKEKFMLETPAGTIDMRGTAIIDYVEPSAEALAASRLAYTRASTAALGSGVWPLESQTLAQNTPLGAKPPVAGPGLPPGLYVSVIDGAINLSNKGGSQSFTAGQFGYTANVTKPPVIVPANPGLKFTPPPTFSSNSGQSGSGSGNKAAAIDCVVR